MPALRGPALFVVAALVAVAVPTTAGMTAAEEPSDSPSSSVSPSPEETDRSDEPSPTRSTTTPTPSASPSTTPTTTATPTPTDEPTSSPTTAPTTAPTTTAPTTTVPTTTVPTTTAPTTEPAAPLAVSASPVWVTAATLQSSGVTLTATGLDRGTQVTGSVGDATGTATAGADGRAAVTVRASRALSAGTYDATLQTLDGPARSGSTPVRVTVLEVAARTAGTQVVGTGFEPGTTVELLIGSTVRGSGQADDTGTVVIDSPVTGREVVTLRGPAGEVTGTLDLVALPDEPGEEMPTAALIAELEKDVAAAEEVQQLATQLSTALKQSANGGSGTLTAADGKRLEKQVALQERITGPMPRDVNQFVRPNTDYRLEADAKEAESLAALEAAEAQYRQTAEDVATDKQAAIDEMMKKIITFMQEMKNAQAEQMRAITRMSVPEVLSTAPLPADGVVTVPVPADFTGLHHVALIEPSSGYVTMWQPFTVRAADDADPTDDTTPAAGGDLPDTGSAATPAFVAVAGLLLMGGAAVLARSRRRPTGRHQLE